MPEIQNIPTTQYIGPRIIPHLWDPILWDATTQYDALAVVQYEGVPYVSRYVPPMGTLPTNTEYWVRWADFNAQLAQVQQQVAEYTQLIDGKADKTELQAAVDEIDAALAEKATHAELDAAIQSLAGQLPPTKDMGIVSDYRFHLRPPEGYPVNALLAAAALDLQDFAEHLWEYDYNTNTTIPLLINSPNYEVTNAVGAKVSCSTFVCDALYKAGYTDLAGLAHFMTGPLRNMTEFLLDKGWTKIVNQKDLEPGDVVATNWRQDSNALDYPGHTFIYAGNGLKYDGGSENLIRGTQPVALNWNTGKDQFYRVLDNGLYAARADANFRYTSVEEDLQDWKVLVIANDAWVENLKRDAKHVTQIMWSPYKTIIRATDDNAINWTQTSIDQEQKEPYSLWSPTSQTYDANVQRVPFANVTGGGTLAMEKLYERQADGSILVKRSGVYQLDLILNYASSLSGEGASQSAQSVAQIQQDTAAGATYTLADSHQTLLKNGCVTISRIAQLNRNDVISGMFGLFNTQSSTATLSTIGARSRLSIFKLR